MTKGMPRNKLSDKIVIAMRQDARRGLTARKAGQMCGVSEQAAQQAIRGDTWKHLNDIEPPVDISSNNLRGKAKLTDDQVRDMRRRREATGNSYFILGMQFGVDRTAAMRICKRESYDWVS